MPESALRQDPAIDDLEATGTVGRDGVEDARDQSFPRSTFACDDDVRGGRGEPHDLSAQVFDSCRLPEQCGDGVVMQRSVQGRPSMADSGVTESPPRPSRASDARQVTAMSWKEHNAIEMAFQEK
jgi:hypothetical protein